MPEPQTQNDSELTGDEALREACVRNIPVEVFRAADRGSAPARGRLLHLDAEELVIEKLQVIGAQFELSRDTMIEGYFRFGSHLFRFDTSVKETMIAARLNGRLIVPALKLHLPIRIQPGQRRSVYRVNTAARGDAPLVRVWLLGPADMPDGADPADPAAQAALHSADQPPPRAHDFSGRVVDASDTGFGILLHDCIYSRLKPMQEIVLAIDLPGSADSLVVGATVRHSSVVRACDARIGVHLTDDGSTRFAVKLRRIVAFLTQIQRSQLR